MDKFTFKIAGDRLYTKEGLWALPEGDQLRIGVSDFTQQRSGDVAFAEIKEILCPGEEVGRTGDRVSMDDQQPDRLIIVPCSGIGKPYGSVSRETAYDVTGELRPEQTQLVALARLVMGDAEALAAVGASPAITIDGCKLACAG